MDEEPLDDILEFENEASAQKSALRKGSSVFDSVTKMFGKSETPLKVPSSIMESGKKRSSTLTIHKSEMNNTAPRKSFMKGHSLALEESNTFQDLQKKKTFITKESP